MKHVANIMRVNDCNPDQESTVGRIMQEGKGKKKRTWIGMGEIEQTVTGERRPKR